MFFRQEFKYVAHFNFYTNNLKTQIFVSVANIRKKKLGSTESFENNKSFEEKKNQNKRIFYEIFSCKFSETFWLKEQLCGFYTVQYMHINI